jgi:hypothetical protein
LGFLKREEVTWLRPIDSLIFRRGLDKLKIVGFYGASIRDLAVDFDFDDSKLKAAAS